MSIPPPPPQKKKNAESLESNMTIYRGANNSILPLPSPQEGASGCTTLPALVELGVLGRFFFPLPTWTLIFHWPGSMKQLLGGGQVGGRGEMGVEIGIKVEGGVRWQWMKMNKIYRKQAMFPATQRRVPSSAAPDSFWRPLCDVTLSAKMGNTAVTWNLPPNV